MYLFNFLKNIIMKDCKEISDIMVVGLQTDPTVDCPEKKQTDTKLCGERNSNSKLSLG
jgi:hypothetical protein